MAPLHKSFRMLSPPKDVSLAVLGRCSKTRNAERLDRTHHRERLKLKRYSLFSILFRNFLEVSEDYIQFALLLSSELIYAWSALGNDISKTREDLLGLVVRIRARARRINVLAQ
jgi:hypothetical protein